MPHTSNQQQDAIQKLSELVKGIRFAMLTTVDEQSRLHSRPMATQQVDFDGSFWFFTDDTAPKSFQIQKEQQVNLAYSSPDEHRFVSVAGKAQIVHDKQKMQELWNPMYRTWFPQGLDTPHICLIRVNVEHAEYWDTQSSAMVHLIGFAKSLATGQRYHPESKPGTNEKFDLTG
jgi:general stress protein 26